uniref:Putative flagellar filament outer layer protein FlaA n=1 Tax=uncultured bacterium contig00015 TaxID=1181506 RepID=A0A806KLW9_9BACT|nr:putative flagellar filament outer layer protein FlaA [uncultured bacterium contig00015]
MKKFLIIVLILFITGFVYAQQQREVGSPDPTRLGIESAQQHLKEVSVDKFEHDGFWHSTMSSDEGYATTRLFNGNPIGKEPLAEEEGLDLLDRYVLGTRIDYLRRGHNSFTIYPTRPIPIEGITKTVSVWVAGRNFNHDLVLLIQDYFGRNYEFFVGKLNFIGWKKLTVAIPPQSEDGYSGVVQRSYHYNNQMGIKIMGFRIDCDPIEAYGSYYIYFDDLRAVTDLFAENNRDEDDMVDGW